MAIELRATNEPQSDMEIKTRKLGYGVKQNSISNEKS